MYWTRGPVRGHSVVQGQIDISVEVQDSGWAKGFNFKVPRGMSEDKFHLGLVRQGTRGLA